MDLITEVHNKGLVVDGAMSTALEKLGVNTQNNLWTAIALVNDLEKVYQVHWDYFQAGAQLTI
ncbi:MAG: homocysteine S-methyltransferase family protein, partial [Bombilactobacillus mellis]|nr:homocysteine S-methyltransferase family protein [Bombilactobacillus mellis]